MNATCKAEKGKSSLVLHVPNMGHVNGTVWAFRFVSVVALGMLLSPVMPNQATAVAADEGANDRTESEATPWVRELEFVETEEVQIRRYIPPHELIADRGYVANIRIGTTDEAQALLRLLYPPVVTEERYAGERDNRLALERLRPESELVADFYKSVAADVERLVELVPENLRPSPERVAELVSANMNVGIPTYWFSGLCTAEWESLERSSLVKVRDKERYTFDWHATLAAKSPEHAKQLAETLVEILDNGLSREIHEKHKAAVEYLERRIPEHDAETAMLPDRLAALQKELETRGNEDLTDEVIAKLSAERRMLAVKIDGLRARIGACERALSQRNAPADSPHGRQVETIKITAEIELVGLMAEQMTIDQIISAGKRRRALLAEIHKVSRRIEAAPEKADILRVNLKYLRYNMDERRSYVAVSPVIIQPSFWHAEQTEQPDRP
jgi:hypothetical protein